MLPHSDVRGPARRDRGGQAAVGLPPWDLDAILAARIAFDERIAEGFPGLIDRATESPGRLEKLIGGLLASGGAFLLLGVILARRR